MQSPDSTTRLEGKDAPEPSTRDGGAFLFVRLWTYSGPEQLLSGLALDQDPEIVELVQDIIADKSRVIDRQPEMLAAHFHDAVQALSAAKTFQQRFLTFQRKAQPQQVVPSILIAGAKAGATELPAGDIAWAREALANSSSAQILVTEWVYGSAKNASGFEFNHRAVREAGENGEREAIYELLWTDESTYGHLREAGTGFTKVGRYELQAELGRGAMGVVYKAYDQLIGRTVALKTISINRNTPDRDDLIERLKQEAKAAGGLDHPNIITIFDVGQENELVYLSMQFLEGKTLQALFAQAELPPLATLLSYADQILSAVGFAHARGVIHRDLKPANLMLTSQNVIKVLDFGIAKIENTSLTQTGLVVGTPAHMAPEQVAGKKIDHRADIFALGSVFYEMVTREKPFRGDVTTILYKIMHEEPVAPSLINPALPGGIDAIIRKALAKDPNERFQSCEEMRTSFREQAAALGRAQKAAISMGLKPSAAPAPDPSKPDLRYLLDETKRPPRPIWPWLAMVVFLVVAGGAGWAFYTKSHTGSYPIPVQKLLALLGRTKQRFKHDLPPSQSPPDRSGASQQAQATPDASAAGTESPATSATPLGTRQAADNPAPAEPASAAGGVALGPQSIDGNRPPADAAGGSPLNSPAAGSAIKAPAPVQNAGASATSSPTPAAPAADASLAGKPQPTDKPDSAPASTAAGSGDNPPDGATDATGFATGTAASKPRRKPVPHSAASVDGFTRRDVPELLRQADAASGRGNYRLARYEYSLILKLDPNNVVARAGLRRAQAAEQDQAR
jgi:serine/threonine protein kinase